jgi:predicted metal-dependent hydrolase
MTTATAYEETLERGIDFFNAGNFFEAHEAWERLWLNAEQPEEKQFLQGLIMAAGSFLHYLKRECKGASVLLSKSVPLLKSGTVTHPEIRLADFTRALEELHYTFDRCSFNLLASELPRIETHRRPFVQRQVY